MDLNVEAYRAMQPGVLPTANQTTVGTVALPRGHVVQSDPPSTLAPNTGPPVLWISNKVLKDAGRRWIVLRRQFRSTGLWPLVLDTLPDEPHRPWDIGEFDPGSASSPDGVDVIATLRDWCFDSVPVEEGEGEAFDVLAPFERPFPGLAPTPQGDVDEDAVDLVAADMRGRLGLVPVRRPADVVAVLGWQGPMNHFNDVGPLSAVLRSWEDRFGAEPVGLGFATLTLGVRRPPTTRDESLPVAVEHFAVCPDSVWRGPGSIGRYAEWIMGQPRWSFWWD